MSLQENDNEKYRQNVAKLLFLFMFFRMHCPHYVRYTEGASLTIVTALGSSRSG